MGAGGTGGAVLTRVARAPRPWSALRGPSPRRAGEVCGFRHPGPALSYLSGPGDTSHGLRPVRHRRRLGRRALRAHRRRPWRARRHRRGALLGRHLRQCRLRAEEAAGAGRRIWRLGRRCRRLRLDDQEGPARLGQADRRQGQGDRPAQRHLRTPAGRRRRQRSSTPARCFIDPHTLDVGGKRVTAEHIVIATGGHPDARAVPRRRTRHHLRRRVLTCRRCRSASRWSAPATSRWSSPASSPALGAEVDLVYRQPLPLRGFDQDMREAAGRGAGGAGHRAASRLHAAAAGSRRRAKRADLRRRPDAAHRPGVLRHRAARRRPKRLGLDEAGVATERRTAR